VNRFRKIETREQRGAAEVRELGDLGTGAGQETVAAELQAARAQRVQRLQNLEATIGGVAAGMQNTG